jgi:hypothetical protein
MGKGGWFGKKKGAVMEKATGTASTQPKVETAVLLVQYENGGKTGIITKISGFETKREATIQDVYRMVKEVGASIKINWTLEGIFSLMKLPVSEQKPEAKPEELKEAPKEQPK